MAPFYGHGQLSQGYRATKSTTRRKLLFTIKSPVLPGTHLVNLGNMKE